MARYRPLRYRARLGLSRTSDIAREEILSVPQKLLQALWSNHRPRLLTTSAALVLLSHLAVYSTDARISGRRFLRATFGSPLREVRTVNFVEHNASLSSGRTKIPQPFSPVKLRLALLGPVPPLCSRQLINLSSVSSGTSVYGQLGERQHPRGSGRR